jgi:antitoxin ParD1/3/4
MLNISLPDSLEAAIAQQAEQAGFDTATNYLVHLVLRDQERLSQQAKIEALLIEGLESGEPIEATDEWWEQKQAMLLWQQVPPTEIAQRLRERAAQYTGSVSQGLLDAAFDRETIYGD